MLFNVTYLIKNKHFLFNSGYLLTYLRTFIINQPAFSNKSASMFYYICELFLTNYIAFSNHFESISFPTRKSLFLFMGNVYFLYVLLTNFLFFFVLIMRSTIISLKNTLWLSIKSQYVVLPKISENLLLITWILTLSPNFHRHPCSYLGFLYNDPSDFVIFGSTHWIQPAWACLVHVACLDLFNGYETPTFQPELHFREHV